MLGSWRAQEIHKRFPAIDLHVDTLMWSRRFGYDMRRRHKPPLPMSWALGQADIPRWVEGGVGGVFLGLVSLPYVDLTSNLYQIVEHQIQIAESVTTEPGAIVDLARTAQDLERCRAQGRIGLLMGLEGVAALGGRIDRLQAWAGRGLRYVGLVHLWKNDAASPTFGLGQNREKGITAFGYEVVEACESLGLIVDLAHINRKGFYQVCRALKRPPFVSHTGLSGVHPHARNIDVDQLRQVAQRGGAVGIMFVPLYLGGWGIERVAKHIKHVIDVAGEDTPAIGSDWDGFIVPTRGLEDTSHLPRLTDAMLDEGLSDDQIGKVLRGNVLRVLNENPLPSG